MCSLLQPCPNPSSDPDDQLTRSMGPCIRKRYQFPMQRVQRMPLTDMPRSAAPTTFNNKSVLQHTVHDHGHLNSSPIPKQ